MALATEDHVLTAQLTQLELPLNDHVPALQERHTEEEVAEVVVDHSPGAQFTQDAMEVAPSTVPHVPTTHPVHVAVPAVDHVPKPHVMQLDEEVADNDVDHVPAVQLMHALMDVAPIMDVHVPDEQGEHDVEIVEDQVPRGHCKHWVPSR